MNTLKNKRYKNELDPKYSFYYYLRSCELKSSSKKTSEECVESCDWEPLSDDLDSQK